MNSSDTFIESVNTKHDEQEDYNLEELKYELIKKIERRYPDATTRFKADKLGVSEDAYMEFYFRACPSLALNIAMEEKRLIKKAFYIYSDKSVIFIAKKLGISSRNIYRKLKEYDLWYLILERQQKEDNSIEFEEIKRDKELEKNYNWENEEKRLITKAMEKNPEKTCFEIAQILGISERTLFNKVIYYGLQHVKERMSKLQKPISKYGF